MRRTFWSLMLTGIAVTALSGFSPTTQEAEGGFFRRLFGFHGDCCSCSGEVATCCTPAPACPPTCCTPAPAPTCCPAPCDACGHHGCNSCCEDHDDDCDDDCDD
ncbi:MAG: hypothetical protein U0992_23245 [Planctomycetaceae bacterium]